MKIIKNFFVIPSGENYILYAPLQGSIMLVNGGVVSLLQDISTGKLPECSETLEMLVRGGIVVEEEKEVKFLWDSDATKSTFLGLIPTTDCNLRCQYCYSSAGERKAIMEWSVAKAGVDFVLANVLAKQNHNDANISFLGGGEPFHGVSWNLVQQIVEYASGESERIHVKTRFGGSTNGILTEKKIDWLTKYFHHLTISLDGPAEIQNVQRPLSNGGPSFELVMGTIQKLNKMGFNYSIRCTVSQEGLPRMEELIDFFAEHTTPVACYVEPIFECGRCKVTKKTSPDLRAFAKNYVKAKERAEKLNFPLRHIMDNISLLTNISCGAGIGNLILTPDGSVTSCPEIISREDHFADKFIYGSYNISSNQFEFSKEKLEYLQSRTVDKLVPCIDCFAKFNCGGDCYIKVARQGDLFDNRPNVRCQMFQDLLKYKLEKSLEVKNG